MRTTKIQLEMIEQIQFLLGTSAELLAIVEEQASRMSALSKRIEQLEAKPKVTPMNRGIRPKDLIGPENPHSHWDYIDPRHYK